MNTGITALRSTLLAAALALLAPAAVLAAPEESSAEQETSSGWQAQREKTVSAREIMDADVYRVATPLGNVRDLVLSEDGSRVEYVLYEIPYPYALHGAQHGYAAFENLAVEQGAGFERQLRLDDDAEPQDPETLQIDRQEADNRLLSRILGDTVRFSGDETRPLEDVLIDRQSGRITGYVVSENPDAWFNEAPRVIPPQQVTIGEQGEVTAATEFAALERVQ